LYARGAIASCQPRLKRSTPLPHALPIASTAALCHSAAPLQEAQFTAHARSFISPKALQQRQSSTKKARGFLRRSGVRPQEGRPWRRPSSSPPPAACCSPPSWRSPSRPPPPMPPSPTTTAPSSSTAAAASSSPAPSTTREARPRYAPPADILASRAQMPLPCCRYRRRSALILAPFVP
jgi:hypothetical protein